MTTQEQLDKTMLDFKHHGEKPFDPDSIRESRKFFQAVQDLKSILRKEKGGKKK